MRVGGVVVAHAGQRGRKLSKLKRLSLAVKRFEPLISNGGSSSGKGATGPNPQSLEHLPMIFKTRI